MFTAYFQIQSHKWMRRSAAIASVALIALTSAGCSQLLPPDSKNQAKERWSSVRSKLKLQLAEESFSNGQLDQAQKHLDEALTLSPDFGEAFVLQAKILLEKGQTASSSEALEAGLRHGADTPETDYLSGVISQRYGKLEDALDWYRRASQREPMHAPYVVAVSEALVALGRPTQALELVQSRLTDFEQNATLRAVAGGIYMMLGRYEEAADSYREAARISPGDARLQGQLGVALTLAENYQEAQTVLAAASAAPDVEPSVLTALGRCRVALRDGEKAKEILRRAVETDPTQAGKWALLARASIESKDLLTARRASTQATQLEPGNREYRLLLGYVCWRQHDYPATVSTLEDLLRELPDDVALYMLADCYRTMGRTEQARQTVDRALAANPNCEWALHWTDAPRSRNPRGVKERSSSP